MKSIFLWMTCVACAFAQGIVAPPVTVGSGAPTPSSCTVVSVGTIYVRSQNPSNAPIGVFRCTQTGAYTYGWQPAGHFVGPTLPAKCSVGDVAFDSDATPGQNWYLCAVADTWTLGSSGGQAASLAGGSTGQVPYQSAPSTTSFCTPNTANCSVVLNGSGNAILPGLLSVGPGTPTKLTVVGTLIGSLPASGNANEDHMLVIDGTDATDCTVGTGTTGNRHWCYWNGTAWVAENSQGPQGIPWTPAAPTAISANCTATNNWAVGSVATRAGTLTTTGSCGLSISGMVAGGYYTVLVTQGSGGSHTLSLVTGGTGGCTAWKVGGGGSGAVTPSTAAGSVDLLAIFYDGSTCWANYRTNFN